MTEVKIPFIKTKVEKYSGPNLPANTEALILEVSSTFNFNQVYEKAPLTSFLTKLRLSFSDGEEKEIYDKLLDDDNISFELSWEKEKVNFCVVGEENGDTDETKMNILFFPLDDASLEINFVPNFAGVVKITYQGPNKKPNKDKNNGGGNQNPPSDNSNETDKKITGLQNQINALEEKLRNQPNSDGDSADKKKLEQLKAQIEELKRKQKNKSPNENKGSDKNDNFPYGLVIGGGVAIFLLLIAVIFFWQRSRRR